MDYKILLTSTLIATIISSIVSAIVSIYLKSREYKYEYKKYILEKRKIAYEGIERIIFTLLRFQSKPDGSDPIHSFLLQDTDEKLKEFNINIVDNLKQSFWISDKSVALLLVLNDHITSIGKHHFQTGESLKLIGINEFKNINVLTENLSKQYFEDISQLDDIVNFKKKKLFY
jgi:hypothetical protein